MKVISPLLLIFFLGCTTYNQEKANLEDEQILIGEVNWDGFTHPPYNEWFSANYQAYQVDTASLNEIKPALQDVKMIVFLGTWCSDSQLQIPQFYKMLDFLEYDFDKMKVVALEKSESGKLISPQNEEAELEITHVPTFIFLKRGVELGRITEYPNKTIEKDMLEIIVQ